jgi:tetratricopeptide (TPR) repeat protein
MRARVLNLVIAAVVAVGVAAASDSPAELKARADAAHGGEQAKLSLEYAQHQLEDANALFTKGDVDRAQGEVVEAVEYSRKAAEAASSSGKHVKQTEIELRKLSKRMHDIGASLAFEDRAPVNQAVEQIEQIRSDLLDRMFGAKAEPKGKS